MILAIVLLGGAGAWAADRFTPLAAERIEAAAPELLERFNEPGLAILLIENATITWRGYFGFADRAHATPVTDRTLFQWGSVSKPIAAAAVMTLIEQGKLELQRPVNAYLTRWKLPSTQRFSVDDVTPERLLRHTAGLNKSAVNGADVNGAARPVATLLDDLTGRGPTRGSLAIVAAPGDGFAYSGGGYGLLQLLVEDVTGQSFDTYCNTALFKPLGMTTATFSPTLDVLQDAATPHAAGGRPWPHRLYPNQAAAGLYATPADFAQFLLSLCDRTTGARILEPTTLKHMFQPTSASPDYGMGFQLHPPIAGRPVIAHTGSNRGWRAGFIVLPTEGLGIVIAANSDSAQSRDALFALWRDLLSHHTFPILTNQNRQPSPR